MAWDTLNKIWEILDKWGTWISIRNLSENDKWELLNYLSGENYVRKWTTKTDSIKDTKDFFIKIDNLTDDKKQEILDWLKEYFKDKEKVKKQTEWLINLQNEKVAQKTIQMKESDRLKDLLNTNNEKEINIEQLKEWWRELTKIIDEITSLGINWIWTTEEDKNKQIEKFLKQTESKEIADEYREKIELFIKKSLDKMYLIKNKYLEWWNLPQEKVQKLICDIMWITDERAKEELSKFVKDSWSQLKIELKWPSLMFYIPYIKKLFWKRSAYWFSIIETQWAINNKAEYEKVANKYLGFGGIKCKDEQVKFEDLKGSVIVLNASKWQFNSTKDVENHEYQHVLNQGYLMPSTSDKHLQDAMDEVLAKMNREDLTNELGLYNYFLEDIKTGKKYNKTTSLQEVLNNLKQNSEEYKKYQEDWDQHKKNVDKYYDYFTKTMENTGLDRKTTANMLAVQPLEKREEITKKK